MPRRNKNYHSAREKIEPREYTIEDAMSLLKEIKTAKFDESVDMSIRLGVDPKYPDQMVRGTVILPHGTGRVKRVLVIAQGKNKKKPRRPAPILSAVKIWWRRSKVKTGSSLMC